MSKLELEKKKLKEMKSFKDRKDYILEYYKIHIISIVLLIIFIIYTLNIMIFNPSDKTAVSLAITHLRLPDSAIETLKTDVEKSIGIEEGYEFTINSFPLGSSQDIKYEQALIQKLYAMITIGDIDLVIGVEEFFKQNSISSLFLDVSELLKNPKYDTLKDKFVMGLVPIENLEEGTYKQEDIVEVDDGFNIILCVEQPIAVRLDTSKILSDLGYDTKETLIGFIGNSKRPDVTIKLFDYIMNID